MSSIKENYDKKFEGLVSKFKEIEDKFISGYFEEKILGELKNSKDKQKEIVARVQNVVSKIEEISRDVEVLRMNSSDFFLFENTRIKLECVSKELNLEERELKKLSYKVADYVNVNIHTKFSDLL